MTDERERDVFIGRPWQFVPGHYEIAPIVWREGEEPEGVGFEVIKEWFPDGKVGKTR